MAKAKPRPTASLKRAKAKKETIRKGTTNSPRKKILKPYRSFFTVGDDRFILNKMSQEGHVGIKYAQIGEQLNRKDTAIRERWKAYLSKLDESDQAKINSAAKKDKSMFVHFEFKGKSKTRKIACINWMHPSIHNREGKPEDPFDNRRSSFQKRKLKFKKNLNSSFVWIIKKLKDPNPEIALSDAVAFLGDMLDLLVEENYTTKKDVIAFLKKNKEQTNLQKIFTHFNVKS